MNAKYMYSLLAVILLFLTAYIGVGTLGLNAIFGIIIPYLAFLTFIVGFARKVIGWSKSYVPFPIPTTCGQQKSLPWFKPNSIDNPSSKGGVLIRMILEVLFFRSLFRNTKMKIVEGDRVIYKLEIWLWAAALAFHWSFLVVILRHLRLFLEPVPICVKILENVDSFFRMEFLFDVIQLGLPGVFLSGLVLLASVLYLLSRRILIPQIKYISLAADYFPLFLIFGIALSGIMMRYFSKVNITAAKELTMGLVTFHPTVPDGIGTIFYVHLFFVSLLLAYFPFSKLMHLGGIFLSPTRNMSTDTRANRHVNPWNYPVHLHTYAEYEDEFREKMVEAGLPVDKELIVKEEKAVDEEKNSKEDTA